jgi:L-seryl-tRNA(Ser) seleniumtransferase
VKRSADPRRALPSVSKLLETPEIAELSAAVPRPIITAAVRAAVARVRDSELAIPLNGRAWRDLVVAALESLVQPSLRPVLNATGIVLHTNLGRAPLADEALDAIRAVASGYSTLEYDIDEGRRGSRDTHCVALLRELTGAEDALVVNNCAAALVLALNTVAAGRDVLLSRGELIEIGGSFRVPEIMARSGARLVEVGTTNRTHLLDYRAAITENTAALVKVHRSNFSVSGFTADVPLDTLAPLAAEHELPLLFDLGSGLLIPLAKYGFPEEPTARAAVEAGASVVLMSGDKLLGGPQAGIVVGSTALVTRMRKNPLARALRVDKLTLAALEATLALYRDPESAVRGVPALAMLCAPAEHIRARAEALAAAFRARGLTAEAVDSEGAVGAGAFPDHPLPSSAVAVTGDAAALARTLRAGQQPVIGRVQDDRLLLDLRSVPERDDSVLEVAVAAALTR